MLGSVRSLYKNNKNSSQNVEGKNQNKEPSSSAKRARPVDGIFSPRGQKTDEEVKEIQTERGPIIKTAEQSKCRSSMDTTDAVPSCPDMYEKLIQDLEADVRKHIRI